MFDLKRKYNEEIKQKLASELEIKNPMLLPRLEKIVISVGAGDYAKDAKIIQNMADTISLIAGQRAVVTLAKKSVAGFKMREGMPMGVKVTLRGNQMYNFLEKLIVIALPRVRDFRGISDKSFDGRGNYSMGIKEQLIFPEISYDKVEKIRGLDISFITTAKSDEEAKALLKALGLPFAK